MSDDEYYWERNLDSEEYTPSNIERERENNTESLLEEGKTVAGSAYGEWYPQEPDSNTRPYGDIPDREPVCITPFYESGQTGIIRQKLCLKFPQPNISVDTSARTVEHEVIGEATVVQKIGEGADEIEVEGICTKNEAERIDRFTSAMYCKLESHRWEGFFIMESSSTSPISDGGAVTAPMNDEVNFEWSHEFSFDGRAIREPERTELSEIDG